MLGRKVICGTTKPMFLLGTGYKQEYVAVFRRAHRMYLPTHHCVLALNMIVVFSLSWLNVDFQTVDTSVYGMWNRQQTVLDIGLSC